MAARMARVKYLAGMMELCKKSTDSTMMDFV